MSLNDGAVFDPPGRQHQETHNDISHLSHLPTTPVFTALGTPQAMS